MHVYTDGRGASNYLPSNEQGGMVTQIMKLYEEFEL